jgi:hypothetical protein
MSIMWFTLTLADWIGLVVTALAEQSELRSFPPAFWPAHADLGNLGAQEHGVRHFFDPRTQASLSGRVRSP